MREPVQLFTSFFNYSIFDSAASRDIQRIYNAWNGEYRVWVMPGLKEIERWHLEVGPYIIGELAIPGENFNVITVTDITKEGRFFPPLPMFFSEQWEGQIPENLFLKWMNAVEPEICPGSKEVEMYVPRIQDGRIYRGAGNPQYIQSKITLEPGPILPISITKGRITHESKVIWPKDGPFPEPLVSPDTQANEWYGKTAWEDSPVMSGLNDVVDQKGRRGVSIRLEWPPPFDEIIPSGGYDLIWQKKLLHDYVAQLAEGKEGIENTVANHTSRYMSEGWTTEARLLVMPVFARGGEDEILFIAESYYNISVKNLRDLLAHPEYHKTFNSPTPITRIWGWEGYFWWEFNRYITEGKKLVHCQRCKEVISGKKGKMYCSQGENSECFRQRRAEDRRRQRSKQGLIRG